MARPDTYSSAEQSLRNAKSAVSHSLEAIAESRRLVEVSADTIRRSKRVIGRTERLRTIAAKTDT